LAFTVGIQVIAALSISDEIIYKGTFWQVESDCDRKTPKANDVVGCFESV
jgi:hypothetical protein